MINGFHRKKNGTVEPSCESLKQSIFQDLAKAKKNIYYSSKPQEKDKKEDLYKVQKHYEVLKGNQGSQTDMSICIRLPWNCKIS